MYYSDELIEEVRSRSDVVDVISAYVKLKRSGSTYFGLCPFHNEKSPSFSVTPGKQMYYCFGCHKGGSVFTFIQEYENVTFPEAVQILAERAGIALPEQDRSDEARRAHSLKEQLFAVNKLAATFYYYKLRGNGGRTGMDYLKGRGLSDEIMQQFGLGYAGQNDRELYEYLRSKNVPDEIIYKSGLMTHDEKRGSRDKFWNRVMFPIMDVSNRVIGFGGRVMGDAKPKYLNSPENEIFNKRRNLYGLNIARRARKGNLILCEGYMDVISMHQAGFSNAVASLGTALTQEHAVLLKRYTDEVILSYDSDSAGVNAALRAIPMLKEAGLRVKILHLEPYKDPDEFAKALGAEELGRRIEQAQNSFFFETDTLEKRYQIADPEERTAFQKEVAAKIAGMDTEAERGNYIQSCADRYMIPVDALKDLVRRALMQGVMPETYRRRTEKTEGRAEAGEGLQESERRLLTWLASYPGFYPVLKSYISPEDYSTAFHREAAALLYDQLEKGQLNEASIVDHFASEDQQAQAARLFHTEAETRSDEELTRAMKETIRKVSDNANRRRSNEGRTPDFSDMIAAKKRLQNLQTLQIDLTKRADR